jgi:ATP-dependent Lon protease
LVTGLAWTSVGGETLEVEVNVMDGSGKLELTGNLGDVMKESAHAALSYIRANCLKLGIAADFYKTKDIHIHVPEGATPKDGPSAGVTLITALVSTLTGIPVRQDVAMTGEITLRGRVLPVGGVKEKILAAKRNGVTDLILSIDNEHDIKDIKEDYINGLNFHYVENMMEVLDLALEKEQDTNDLDYNKYLNNLHPEVIGFKVK